MGAVVGPGTLAGALTPRLARVSARGLDRLPSSDPDAGPAIVVANHTTIVDVAIVLHVMQRAGLWVDAPCRGGCAPGHRHATVMATADILRFPVSKQLAKRTGVIAVERDGGAAAFRAARASLEAGRVLLLYPEGDVSATADGAPRPWRPGTATLARMAGVPVHPLAHHDSRRLGHGKVPVALARAATGVWRLPPVRVLAGDAVPAEVTASTPARDLEPLLAAALTRTWTGVRDARDPFATTGPPPAAPDPRGTA